VGELGEKLQDAYAQLEQVNEEKNKLIQAARDQEEKVQQLTANLSQIGTERQTVQEEVLMLTKELSDSQATVQQLEEKTEDLIQKMKAADQRYIAKAHIILKLKLVF
jgi:chromosome segregation ATPase